MEYSVELEFSSPFMEQWTLDAGGVLYYDNLAPGIDTRDKMAPAPEIQMAPRRIRGQYLRKRLKSLHNKGKKENVSSSPKLGPRAAGVWCIRVRITLE